ncbi:MAG: hypothetical protein A2096_08445 [Spirochaetes bacterium GWF1_41_5]|nr:MAG: hypothetical protein A2096_08445 [Spirochaetes bacterium GWF1_41_5]HBE02582.1 hypothetical protein [Spirochaetia bacterium]
MKKIKIFILVSIIFIFSQQVFGVIQPRVLNLNEQANIVTIPLTTTFMRKPDMIFIRNIETLDEYYYARSAFGHAENRKGDFDQKLNTYFFYNLPQGTYYISQIKFYYITDTTSYEKKAYKKYNNINAPNFRFSLSNSIVFKIDAEKIYELPAHTFNPMPTNHPIFQALLLAFRKGRLSRQSEKYTAGMLQESPQDEDTRLQWRSNYMTSLSNKISFSMWRRYYNKMEHEYISKRPQVDPILADTLDDRIKLKSRSFLFASILMSAAANNQYRRFANLTILCTPNYVWRKKTALHYAVQFSAVKAVHELIKLKANPAVVFPETGSLVTYAAYWHCPDVLPILITNGAPIDSQDARKNTALHYAAAYGSIPMLETLMAAGADPFIRNDNWQRPSSYAADKGKRKAAALLKRYESEYKKQEPDTANVYPTENTIPDRHRTQAPSRFRKWINKPANNAVNISYGPLSLYHLAFINQATDFINMPIRISYERRVFGPIGLYLEMARNRIYNQIKYTNPAHYYYRSYNIFIGGGINLHFRFSTRAPYLSFKFSRTYLVMHQEDGTYRLGNDFSTEFTPMFCLPLMGILEIAFGPSITSSVMNTATVVTPKLMLSGRITF